MRPALIGVALVATLALAGCAQATSPTSASSESTSPHVSAPSASPSPSDPLAGLDSTLSTADGAENQSQNDLSSGDASAAKNDDQ